MLLAKIIHPLTTIRKINKIAQNLDEDGFLAIFEKKQFQQTFQAVAPVIAKTFQNQGSKMIFFDHGHLETLLPLMNKRFVKYFHYLICKFSALDD